MEIFDGDYNRSIDLTSIAQGPLRLGVSGCLLGEACNYRGVDNPFEQVQQLRDDYSRVIEWVSFCPEQHSMGTPREPMNIVGGDGRDVLNGEAVVLTHSGQDCTEEMLQGAEYFLGILGKRDVKVVLLMEGSPSCGSTWVYDGKSWPEAVKRPGVGVTTALLERGGIVVLSPLNNLGIEQLENHLKALLKAK